jgi:DNA polymerase-1
MRTLLIDGDVVAYKTATVLEKAIEWEPGYWTWHAQEDQVKVAIEAEIERYMDELNADQCKIALTDSEKNFRKDILPTYKGNRANVKKPLVLMAIREWLIEEHDAYLKPRLEGDDVLGILSTWRKLKGEKIIVSIDKDMKTIPGYYCRDLELGVIEIDEDEADYWHMLQTLMGDTTDGYRGCPNVGEKAAVEILKEPRMLYSEEYTISRGKHAGELRVRWVEGEPCSVWEAIVSRYAKAGLTEADAIVQARVARILRASDYDFKAQNPILWTPPSV